MKNINDFGISNMSDQEKVVQILDVVLYEVPL